MALLSRLQVAYYIAIAMSGLIGNTTTIIVFSQQRLRSLRSSFFLTCLAITDLAFILILVIALLDELHTPVMTKPVCMFTIYLSHIASFLSSNFTLSYTMHRLVAVLFPIKATTFLKQRTNRTLALILLIFASIFYLLSFPVTTTKVRSNTTNIVYCEEDRYKPLLFPFLVLDTLFTFIIPFTCITFMNLTIVYRLQKQGSYKQQMFTPSITTLTSCSFLKSSHNSLSKSVIDTVQVSHLHNDTTVNKHRKNHAAKISYCLLSQHKRQKKQHQNGSLVFVLSVHRHKEVNNHLVAHRTTESNIPCFHPSPLTHIRSTQHRATTSAKTTRMLLAASTVFLVFNLPYHLLLFCFLFIKQQPSWMLDAVNTARLWFFASFSVNFFVYAIWSQRFRHEVVRLLSCLLVRRYMQTSNQKTQNERQNSICLSHRLLQVSSTHLSHFP